ncbi:thermonuclease family protein [Methylibium sp. T29-B]|uniref:thermonuclease family protein n=1 Tax=Methylibium sp. T29-B TaxID=1437443 RepID=UPI0004B20A3C|nr:thermonuclease family protein [Methylibium sp. T29-B]
MADGDTVTVLDADRTQHKIRVAGIDAPEMKQAFGQRSKASMSDLVFGKDVVVMSSKRDRYGRLVGKVLVADPSCTARMCPKTLDAGWHRSQPGWLGGTASTHGSRPPRMPVPTSLLSRRRATATPGCGAMQIR